jgi:hypothetical protein
MSREEATWVGGRCLQKSAEYNVGFWFCNTISTLLHTQLLFFVNKLIS